MTTGASAYSRRADARMKRRRTRGAVLLTQRRTASMIRG
jgi:hypothetical protein